MELVFLLVVAPEQLGDPQFQLMISTEMEGQERTCGHTSLQIKFVTMQENLNY